jgi:hypothetical protein
MAHSFPPPEVAIDNAYISKHRHIDTKPVFGRIYWYVITGFLIDDAWQSFFEILVGADG